MENNMARQDRRIFMKSVAGIGIATALNPFESSAAPVTTRAAKGAPICVSSHNGLKATAKAMAMILEGSDALDAVIAGVNIVEDDPNDNTVGYGGLPNEDGIVELDSCVMHGPTARGAGVAALRNIKNPSKVARLVMERTDHVLIVGDGALRFAKAHGFKEEDLLTDASRERWLQWKENLSTKDDWLPAHDQNTRDIGSLPSNDHRETGTINCLGLDKNGNISGVTTTSGLAFKIPGRVGDSPILGAGLYVDNEVGAAGSTGRGEANLLSCSSVMVVEYMRQGKSPEQACLLACERIAHNTRMARLQDANGRPAFNVSFYAINVKGESGGASIYAGMNYARNTGQAESVLVEGAYLFKR
jgi:N4-(beta-N-acetylglucosaminyl)-L-asparaginase